jgi:hypothetical protein
MAISIWLAGRPFSLAMADRDGRRSGPRNPLGPQRSGGPERTTILSEAMREEPRASTEGASTAGKIVGRDGCSGTEPPIGRRQRARRDWSAEPRETLPLPSCRAKRKGHARFTKDAVHTRSNPDIFNAVAARDGISQSVPAILRGRRARASDGQCQPQPCRSGARFKRADFGLPKGREGVLALPTDPAPNPRASAGLGVFYCQFKS